MRIGGLMTRAVQSGGEPSADDPQEPIDIVGLEPAEAKEWLASMLLIREFETACDALVKSAMIVGAIHSSVGQEAVAVGSARAIRPGDLVAATHRSHHHALAMGLHPAAVMAELFGRADGVAGGRGGSMHLTDLQRGFIGGDGVVGGGLGIAMGAALGVQLAGKSHIAVGFIGDGGVNTGRTWEAVNLAVVWSLPLVIVCENNLYAVETPTLQLTGGGSITERAAGFGIVAQSVDGQDVRAVHDAVAEARERALGGHGPTFIEARTYRYEGHNTGQVIRYRAQSEVAMWRATRDPIDRLRTALARQGDLGPEEAAAQLEAAQTIVKSAIEFAESSSWPDPNDAFRNVTGLALHMPRNAG
jgi:TPP-dependent pyruvate/acetoin dehydrogenase alpha subunit